MKKLFVLITALLVGLCVSCGKKSWNVLFVDELFPENNQEIEVVNMEKIELPEIEIPFGYHFLGWYYKENDEFIEWDESKPIESDMNFYAQYKKKTVEEIMNDYVEELLSTTTSYIPSWNKESFKGRWNYIDGVFLNSIVELYHQTNQSSYRDFFLRYINYYILSDGTFINPKTKEATGYKQGELDSVCESKILFDAYEMTKDSRYLKAIEKTYQELVSMPKATGSPNFWHKTSYENQIWLDGMYMYVPFYARYAQLKNKPEIFDEIKSQYEYVRNHMFDENKKLYYHGHDTTKSIFWADPNTGNSKSFWLRSMGWFMVSLCDVLPYFPNGESKDYLIDLLKEAIEGILPYQDSKTKMFYQVVDLGPKEVLVPKSYLRALKNTAYQVNQNYVDSNIKNYVEASGSSMIAYCLMKGAHNQYLDATYLTKGKEILNGIFSHSFLNGKLNDICITAGLGPDKSPHRDGTKEYYLAEPVGSDDAKGVGPFLMAYIESMIQ